jgi:hypothetical protein
MCVARGPERCMRPETPGFSARNQKDKWAEKTDGADGAKLNTRRVLDEGELVWARRGGSSHRCLPDCLL